MYGRRACIGGVCVWLGACMAGGVHGRGHAWQGEGACMTGGICGIRSMNGRSVCTLLECILV